MIDITCPFGRCWNPRGQCIDPAECTAFETKTRMRMLSRLGGQASAAKLTPEQRKARATKAAAARWRKEEP